MTRNGFLLLCACLAVPALFASCQSAPSKPRTEWSDPLPSLDKIEQCQRADLQRYYGSTFRFHLYNCWASVSIDNMGRVTAFQPEDADAREEVLATKC